MELARGLARGRGVVVTLPCARGRLTMEGTLLNRLAAHICTCVASSGAVPGRAMNDDNDAGCSCPTLNLNSSGYRACTRFHCKLGRFGLLVGA
jgi:hypothetical protein